MILRWDVPVDDREHQIKCGSIVHVDCRRPQEVTFWADDFAAHNRTLRVFATGQPVVCRECAKAANVRLRARQKAMA